MKTILTAANDEAGHRPSVTVDVTGPVALLARAAAKRAVDSAQAANANEDPTRRTAE